MKNCYTIMLHEMNKLGKKMTGQEMKQMKGGCPLIDEPPPCIMFGQPCAGGGCDDPQPICCGDYVCSGSNGIVYNPGICALPGTGGGIFSGILD